MRRSEHKRTLMIEAFIRWIGPESTEELSHSPLYTFWERESNQDAQKFRSFSSPSIHSIHGKIFLFPSSLFISYNCLWNKIFQNWKESWGVDSGKRLWNRVQHSMSNQFFLLRCCLIIIFNYAAYHFIQLFQLLNWLNFLTLR